jgi:diguanylate cyclase
MFWKKDAPVQESVRPASRREEDPETAAIESVAAFLRSMGRHSFDLDDLPKGEIEERFEQWAMKLLVGEAHNDSEPGNPAPSRRGIIRDWGGVRRFVEAHRKEESEYVTAGFENLRQAVRVFMQTTTGTLREERESGKLMNGQLDALDQALAVNDHQEIRRSAENTARTVREQMERRKHREFEQLEALRQSVAALEVELEQAKRAATIDALTQVFNRASLDVHLAMVADQAFLSGKTACVVMIDIDHFKNINDNYGHPTGDEVLRQVADTIVRGFLRREDFVARYGGEEFCIVAQHTTFETTRDRCERLRKTLEEMKIEAFGKRLRISVSFGIAALEPGESAKSWLTRADEALYRAKQKGRNRISVAPPGFSEVDFAARASAPSSHPSDFDGPIRIISETVSVEEEAVARSESPPISATKAPPRAIAALLGNRSS